MYDIMEKKSKEDDFMDKVKKWFFDEDGDGEDVVEEYDAVEVDTEPKTSEAVKSLNMNKDSHLVLFEPRSFGETQDIANYLKTKKATVVNLHRLQKDQAKRVVDFLSGVIYAIEGDIQRIGPKIFLCTPRNISVAGTIDLDEDEQED